MSSDRNFGCRHAGIIIVADQDAIDLSVNSSLMKKYRGQLGAIITSISVSDAEMDGDITALLKRVSRSSFIQKNRKFDIVFREGSADVFGIGADPALNRCSVCHRDYYGEVDESADLEEDLRCPDCEKFVRLGNLIPKIKYVYRVNEDGPHCLQTEETNDTKTYYRLSETRDLAAEASWVVFEDRDDLINDLATASGVLFAKTYMTTVEMLPAEVRTTIDKERTLIRNQIKLEEDGARKRTLQEELNSMDGQNPATHEHLAESCPGSNYIGALRMDADNVGKIMQGGFQGSGTLEALSFLSRSINYFFRIHLNAQCARAAGSLKDRMIHVIYAGGDDLFALGAWNDVAELSIELGETFKRYTCGNPDMGLSGGFSIHKGKYPVKDMAASSFIALNHSKRDLDLCWQCMSDFTNCMLYRKDGHCLRKDSLTPFFSEYKASYKNKIDVELIQKGSSEPSRLKLSFKRGRPSRDVHKRVDEVNDFIRRPYKIFTEPNVPHPPHGFLNTTLRALRIWYSSGLLYMPLIAWLIQKQKNHLKSMIDTGSELSMYELYDWTLHITSPEMISALHVPLSWAILSQRGEKAG